MDTSTTGRRTRIQPSSLPLVSLKRKAADQPLSATQNLISEALVETSPAVNQILPNIMSLARVIQRSRAVASGSSQHQEATTSEDFTLPPTCTSTRRDEPFVLYDGSTDRGVRVIIFATSRINERIVWHWVLNHGNLEVLTCCSFWLHVLVRGLGYPKKHFLSTQSVLGARNEVIKAA